LFNYSGDFQGQMNPKEFHPIGNTPVPGPGVPLMCQQCGQRWHMLKTNGSIVVVTDRGIMPKAPHGPKRIFTYPQEVVRLIDPYNQSKGTDYEEPTHVESNRPKD
jgi:hypothetical protein